jgi:hypothetical protein
MADSPELEICEPSGSRPHTIRYGRRMSYIDGYVVPVKTARKQDYIDIASHVAKRFLEWRAARVVEFWGDDVPDGEPRKNKAPVDTISGRGGRDGPVRSPQGSSRPGRRALGNGMVLRGGTRSGRRSDSPRPYSRARSGDDGESSDRPCLAEARPTDARFLTGQNLFDSRPSEPPAAPGYCEPSVKRVRCTVAVEIRTCRRLHRAVPRTHSPGRLS